MKKKLLFRNMKSFTTFNNPVFRLTIIALWLVMGTVYPSSAQLSISSLNQPFIINFDTTVADVNNGQYNGSGFSPLPSVGQINSNAFSVKSANNNLNFGETETSGFYALGVSLGTSNSGGFYAYEPSLGNRSFGFRASNGVGATLPNYIILKVVNNTSSPIVSFQVSYKTFILNTGVNSSEVFLSHSKTLTSFDTLPSTKIVTPSTPGSQSWVFVNKSVSFNLASPLLTDSSYYLAFNHTPLMVSTANGFDPISFDDISVTASVTVAGINEDKLNQINLSLIPNFGDGRFEVQTIGNNRIHNIQVFTTTGALAYEGKSQAVEASHLPSGLYIVKVTTTEGVVVKRYNKEF